MLNAEVPVHGDEDVELSFPRPEQVAVQHGRPAHLRDGLHVVAGQVRRQPAVDAFVEQESHVADATMRAFASSRKAMT